MSSDNNVDYDHLWAHLDGYKNILGYNVPSWLNVKYGKEMFTDLKCPVDKCRLTNRFSERNYADLILFNEKYVATNDPRPKNQIYALYIMESPPHTPSISYPGKFLCVLHFGITIAIIG